MFDFENFLIQSVGGKSTLNVIIRSFFKFYKVFFTKNCVNGTLKKKNQNHVILVKKNIQLKPLFMTLSSKKWWSDHIDMRQYT